LYPPLTGPLESDEPDSEEESPVRLLVAGMRQESGEEGFRIEVEVRKHGDSGDFVPSGEVWQDGEGFGSRGRIDATMALGRAAAAWSPLRRLLEPDVPESIEIDADEIGDLVDSGRERLDSAGIGLRFAPDLDPGLEVSVAVGSSGTRLTSVADSFDGNDPIAYRWVLSLDGVALDEEERLAVAWAGDGVAQIRGRSVLVGPNLARKARIPDIRSLTALDALAIALTGSTEVDGQTHPVEVRGWLEELRDVISSPAEASRTESDPRGLAGDLRPYQRDGVAWLDRMVKLGLGGCLADDMGLGKTVMLIALHLTRMERSPDTGPTLVVCPTSIVANWEREIQRFAPGEAIRRYHGPGRSLDGVESGFVVTSYGTLRTDVETLSAIDWGMIAADEAQHVKNHRTAAAKALRLLQGRARVALTGTPVENDLEELWSILDWTTPGLLGGIGEFRKQWVKPIEERQDTERTEAFRALVGPFVLRRRKSDPGILPELPPKTEADHTVTLTEEQVRLYEEMVGAMMRRIAGTTGIGRRGLVLEAITGLKQICNHPAQFLGQHDGDLAGRAGKLDLFDDLVQTAVGEGGSVLVFSQYVEMAKLLVRRLKELGIEPGFLHGGTPAVRRQSLVDRFQEGSFPVFVLSLKAGGQGLNLTAADHVIHYDRWWNPAVEDQATDRAHRIGQDSVVEVHRLIAEGTVEDHIAELHSRKRQLAEAVVESGPEAFTELGDAELLQVLALRSSS
jgi:SNF2 family DNA or RNA helicase